MKDTVPLGTGNSRTLKSGIDGNMTWEQFRAALIEGTLPIDLGALKPEGVTQIGDPLNKANLLPDDVVAALRLSGNPQVADALAVISGAFVDTRKHWWEKIGYNVTFGNAAKIYAFYTAGTGTSLQPTTLSYSANYKIIDGFFTLVNPTTVVVGGAGPQAVNPASVSLKDKYIIVDSPAAKGLCTSNFNYVSSNEYGIQTYAMDYQPVTVILAGKDLVWSYQEDTYPKADAMDGYYYKYIGRSQHVGAQIATGSYTGTGTYGASNPNRLTFSGSPFVVAIQDRASPGSRAFFFVQGGTCYGFMASSSSVNDSGVPLRGLPGTISGNTLSWYNTANALSQLNISGVVYDYNILYL